MPGAWLDSAAMQRASDIVLGGLLAIAAAVALLNVEGASFSRLDQVEVWLFPAAVSVLLLIVGGILVARGIFVGPSAPKRWHPAVLAIVAVLVAASVAAGWNWLPAVIVFFGPSEFATLIALELAVVIALARGSLIRAVGVALLGLLLSTVGINLATGSERFTMGVQHLADGLMLPVVALGLIVVADGLLCLLSPSLYLATYVRHVAGWTAPTVPVWLGAAMRALAALTIGAAVLIAYRFNAAVLDVGLLLTFAAFGMACRIFGWSRLVLILALALGPLLEQNLARALLLSQGDPATFTRWPLSAVMLLLTCGVLAAALLLSARRALLQRRSPA